MDPEEETFIRRMFNSYDLDDNGYLDKMEFYKVVKRLVESLTGGQTDEEINQITNDAVEEFDLNHNEKIEFNEFRELVIFLIEEKGLSINI